MFFPYFSQTKEILSEGSGQPSMCTIWLGTWKGVRVLPSFTCAVQFAMYLYLSTSSLPFSASEINAFLMVDRSAVDNFVLALNLIWKPHSRRPSKLTTGNFEHNSSEAALRHTIRQNEYDDYSCAVKKTLTQHRTHNVTKTIKLLVTNTTFLK